MLHGVGHRLIFLVERSRGRRGIAASAAAGGGSRSVFGGVGFAGAFAFVLRFAVAGIFGFALGVFFAFFALAVGRHRHFVVVRRRVLGNLRTFGRGDGFAAEDAAGARGGFRNTGRREIIGDAAALHVGRDVEQP